MSKVHEALRKAQEERAKAAPASNRPARQESHLRSVEELLPIVAGPAQHPPVEEAKRPSSSGPFVRFDDLLKRCAEPVWQPDQNAIVFSGAYAPSQGAEQFRTLRTRLYQMRDGAPLKRILVTSAVAAEGKTFVVTNLAQAFACEPGRKILLVDGDLRSPRLHAPLGAPVSPGLAEYLRDHAAETEIIQHGQEGNLCFIAGGRGGENNATELLSNGRFQKLLDGVAPLFDWVLIDSPPCLPVSDPTVLAGFVDGVLLVANSKSTPSALVQKAREELRKRNVLGVVLNAVEPSRGYGYHGYGYSHAYGEQSKEKKKNFLL